MSKRESPTESGQASPEKPSAITTGRDKKLEPQKHGGALTRAGGARPGGGRKPSEVKDIERRLMDAIYPVPGPDGKPMVDENGVPIESEIGLMCVRRLIAISQGADVDAAVKACVALLDRKFGKPKQAVDLGAGVGSVTFQLFPIGTPPPPSVLPPTPG